MARAATSTSARQTAEQTLVLKERAVAASMEKVKLSKSAIILFHGATVKLSELEIQLQNASFTAKAWNSLLRVVWGGSAPLDRELQELREKVAVGITPLAAELRAAEASLVVADREWRDAQAAVYNSMTTERALLARIASSPATSAHRDHQAKLTAARDRYSAAKAQCDTLQLELKKQKPAITAALKDPLAICDEIALLDQRVAQGIEAARAEARGNALDAFLDRYYIASEDIPKITANLKAALRSYGIETAADVTPTAVDAVPGFGPVRTKALLDWRGDKMRLFQYQTNAEDLARRSLTIRRRSRAERRRKERDLLGHQARINTWLASLRQQITLAEQEAEAAAQALAQCLVDDAYIAGK